MAHPWNFGLDLAAFHWPAAQARGRVLLAHGFGEHVGRYARLIGALNAAGFEVYSYDQRGHGQSAGRRALVQLDQLVEDHLRAREALRVAGAPPLFAFGHSMGGLVTALSVARDPRGLQGVVLSSPALLLDREHTALMRGAVQLLGRLLPALPVQRLSPSLLAADPDVGRAYSEDPLVYHGGVRAGSAASMIREARGLWPLLPRWTLPTLLIQGEGDGIVHVEGARRFAREAASADLTYVEEPGGQHELFNDRDQERFRQLLTAWLLAHLGEQSPT